MATSKQEKEELECPHCGASGGRVTNTDKSSTEIGRRRECPRGHKYQTVEKVKGNPHETTVRRSSGRVEAFDIEKLGRSIALACVEPVNTLTKGYAKEVDLGLTKTHPSRDEIPTLAIGREAIEVLREHSPASALRYAMTFYARRPEQGVGAVSIDDLVDRILVGELNFTGPDVPPDAEPLVVSKKPKPAMHGRTAFAEDFQYQKLWRSLVKATRGTVLPASKPTDETQSPEILRTPEGLSYEDGYRHFVTVVTAHVVREISGVLNVTSGRIAAACVDALIEVHPLAAGRYSTAAKVFNGNQGFNLLIAEVKWVRDQHKALIPDDAAVKQLRSKWDRVAQDPLCKDIEASVKKVRL